MNIDVRIYYVVYLGPSFPFFIVCLFITLNNIPSIIKRATQIVISLRDYMCLHDGRFFLFYPTSKILSTFFFFFSQNRSCVFWSPPMRFLMTFLKKNDKKTRGPMRFFTKSLASLRSSCCVPVMQSPSHFGGTSVEQLGHNVLRQISQSHESPHVANPSPQSVQM